MASRICVLGGSGFIGNILQTRLGTKYRVSSPARQDVNITDINSLSSYLESHPPFDVIVNCAGSVNSDLSYFNHKTFRTNIDIITNLYQCKHLFGRLINFGSGAEFDRTVENHNTDESSLYSAEPQDHYGFSKQISAKIVVGVPEWYHLRLFGVFGPTEHPTRLLKRIQQKENLTIVDRLFSYFYVEDVVPVVEYYINEKIPEYKDINLVYQNSIRLWEFVTLFCQLHQIENPAVLSNETGLCYTGNGKKLSTLNLPLAGLEEGLRHYQ